MSSGWLDKSTRFLLDCLLWHEKSSTVSNIEEKSLLVCQNQQNESISKTQSHVVPEEDKRKHLKSGQTMMFKMKLEVDYCTFYKLL